MQRQVTERALIGAFICSLLLSIYLALYWSAPYVMWGSPNNGEPEVKSACEQASGCKAVRMDIGFSGETRRPVYVAHLRLRSGAKSNAITAAVRTAMQAAIMQQSIPFRWVLDEHSIAVEVTYHD